MDSSSTTDNKTIKVKTQDKQGDTSYQTRFFQKKVKVEYKDIPPQIFISQLNQFIRDHQPPRGFKVDISWERVLSTEEVELEEQQQSEYRFLL